MDAPILPTEDELEYAPVEWLFMELIAPVTAARWVKDDTKRGMHQEKKTFPAGTHAIVNLFDDDPKCQYPYRIVISDYPEFLWVGKQHRVYRHWVQVVNNPDGSQTHFMIDPPDDAHDLERGTLDEETLAVPDPCLHCCDDGTCCNAPDGFCNTD